MSPSIIADPSGLLVVEGTGDGSGFPTLADYRHALADQLGLFGAYRVSAVATGGEPARHVLAEELRDDEEARSYFAGGFVYVKTGDQAGQQRRILQEGYEGPQGALRLSRPFSAPLQAGVAIEVTHPLPVRRHLTTKGINDIIGEALERLAVKARIPLTGNDTRMYSLAAYPWLTRQEQTDGIYEYGYSGSPSTIYPPTRSSHPYEIRTDGGTITLETARTYTTTETFYLSVFVPANRLVFDGVAWNYTTAGFAADTDQAAAPLQWVVVFGMVKGLQYLTRLVTADKMLSRDEKTERLSEITDRRRTWGAAAKRLVSNSLPQPTPEAARGMTGGLTQVGPGYSESPYGWPDESGWPA
jgi:hypothetical protein